MRIVCPRYFKPLSSVAEVLITCSLAIEMCQGIRCLDRNSEQLVDGFHRKR
jgi:hypothetical protein